MSSGTVVVTGSSGFVGQVLLPRLEQDPAVERVVGIDLRLPPVSSKKLDFHLLDIRDPQVEALLAGADVLVHLAFVLMRRPGDTDEELDATNVGGTQAVCRAAARQGVRKLIFTSSVVAYGLHADNPIPLVEDSPLRPNPDLYYGRAKVEVEHYLDRLEAEFPQMILTRLRPCTLVGPHADPAQMASLVGDLAIAVRGADPPYQLLHEEDLARALQLVIRRDCPGAYNVTSDEPRTMRQLVSAHGGRVIALPYALVRGLMWLLWRTGRSVFAPVWADLSRYPLVASNEKLKRLGWTPQYSTAEAFAALRAGADRKGER